MKIIAIGDIHGRKVWEQIVESQDFDKIVFIGDYFDTFDPISAHAQMHNFDRILQYKKDNMDKVVLLVGNHDYHYMTGIIGTYTGYQHKDAIYITHWLHKGIDNDLMQMCYIHDDLLFSHAGVTTTWLINQITDDEVIHVGDFINDLFKYKPRLFGFTSGKKYDRYGDEICQTPIWIRPKSLKKDALEGYTQIVGHTAQDEIVLGGDVVLIDTLGTSGEYLCIKDGKMTVLKSN